MALTDRVFCVTLAALLHDIGKPLQRANRSDKTTLQTIGAKSMAHGDLVGYQHALWTSDFLFRWEKELTQLPAVRNYRFEQFQKLASKHHKPDSDNPDELIIQAADWASAGADRKDDTDTTESNFGRETYIKKPLVSLFTRITIDDIQSEPKYHGLGSLDSENIFPSNDIELSAEKYSVLMAEFEQEFGKLPFTQPALFLDALVSLITRLLWCVPSSTVDGFADIPLSDHCITTAAIAAATAVANDATGVSPRQTSYLLVSGDFAGIQKFIFTLTGESNRKIAKLLRGRSFMVNMYNILAARLLTDACGLPALNAISTAGGKFQVLLADTLACRKCVVETGIEIQKWVHEQFFGELKLIIDVGVPFSYQEFELQKFQKVLAAAAVSLNREKLRPFSKILSHERDWVDDEGFPEFKKSGMCKICGVEPAVADVEPGVHCEYFIKKGMELPNGRIVKITDANGTGIFNRFDVSIINGISANEPIPPLCYRINLHLDSDPTMQKLTLPELHYSNYTPKVEDAVNDGAGFLSQDNLSNKTFEDIANEGDGLDALAVLKADLDNMGYIFIDGFKSGSGTSTLSISRMVSLSRMVNWFFAGYLPVFISKNPKYKNIYTLFAGGDDLCLIGRWDAMVDFAREMQAEFVRYTGNAATISISAGLELFKQRYPVVKAVANAEELLEQSKHNPGKNSITLFGHTMKWGEELQSQIDFADNWKKFVDETGGKDGGNKNGMLYRFLKYYQEWAVAIKERKILSQMKHRFRFIYDINRNLKPGRNDDTDWRERRPFVDLLITKSSDMEKSQLFAHLPVGISLAAYTGRNTTHNIGETV